MEVKSKRKIVFEKKFDKMVLSMEVMKKDLGNKMYDYDFNEKYVFEKIDKVVKRLEYIKKWCVDNRMNEMNE